MKLYPREQMLVVIEAQEEPERYHYRVTVGNWLIADGMVFQSLDALKVACELGEKYLRAPDFVPQRGKQ